MKKIALVFLLLFIPKVNALTYTDYSDFSEEKVTSSNLNFVKGENAIKESVKNELKQAENSTFTSIQPATIQKDYDKFLYKKESNIKETTNILYFVYFIVFLILSIIILVLSKCYKSTEKYVKVKTVMVC